MIFLKLVALTSLFYEKFVSAGISQNVLNLRKYSRNRREIDCGGPLVMKTTVVMKCAVYRKR